jgi:hypothetical protein
MAGVVAAVVGEAAAVVAGATVATVAIASAAYLKDFIAI